MSTTNELPVTREMFAEFETLRQSGIMNMFGARKYLGWDRAEFLYVLRHYEALNAKWPEVKAEVVKDAAELRKSHQ